MATDELGSGSPGALATLTAPGGYVYCLSIYAKAVAPATLTLLIGARRFSYSVGASWQRISCSGSGEAGAESTTFGVELGAGAVVDVHGLQVESQESPSLYKTSTTGGCFESARLRDDTFTFTTTDVNRHSATVHILYASHL